MLSNNATNKWLKFKEQEKILIVVKCNVKIILFQMGNSNQMNWPSFLKKNSLFILLTRDNSLTVFYHWC